MLLKLIKRACLLLALATAQHAGAFVLWGPIEALQTADLDFSNPAGSIRYYYFYVEPGFDGRELGGPKNFGEASRLTTPIITYGFDDTFLDYFGAQGVAAVDSAFALLNSLPSASSASLAKFLTEGAEQVNYTAQAMELLDMKSTVLWLMANHMGLLGETHVYDLASRTHVGVPPCEYEYTVVNYNLDPVTHSPTYYVNGRLYDYSIWDGCPVAVPVGAAVVTPADATSTRWSAVATGNNLQLGSYYLNFTRDDMAGLQYLYKKSYYAYQQLDSNSLAQPFTSSWASFSTNELITGITGVSNFDGLLGGVEKILFYKVNFDSQLNPGFTPVSYTYTVPWVTNYHLYQLHVERTVTAPDILFTAANLLTEGPPLSDPELSRSGGFIASTYVSEGGGTVPATIDPTELIILNNVGPTYFNYSPYFLDNLQYGEYPIFNWGSFDGSTNPPVVFPQGSSLAELEAQVVEGGVPVTPNEWAPVLNSNTNIVTTGGGGGAGGGAGATSVP
jgi:hypothetical protein